MSLPKRDVSIVDSFRPLMFMPLGWSHAIAPGTPGPRGLLVLALLTLWALRLSIQGSI